MNINDNFIVMNTLSFEGGVIPPGAIIIITDINGEIATVSIKPYITHDNRIIKNTEMSLSFINKNSTKIKTKV